VVKPFNDANWFGYLLRGKPLPKNVCRLKPSAASAHLMKHTGQAVRFDNIEDLLKARIRYRTIGKWMKVVCLVLEKCSGQGYP